MEKNITLQEIERNKLEKGLKLSADGFLKNRGYTKIGRKGKQRRRKHKSCRLSPEIFVH